MVYVVCSKSGTMACQDCANFNNPINCKGLGLDPSKVSIAYADLTSLENRGGVAVCKPESYSINPNKVFY